jgi:Fur family ferric uptake transcriptional regulator
MLRSSSHAARERIATTGARVTAARVAVLEALLASTGALSHHDLAERIASVDRVTLYRVLEWLVSRGLAHRRTDGDGVWRFLASGTAHGAHAHFCCNRCGAVSCLPTQVQPRLRLPAGYRRDGVDLTVRGLCAGCTAR